MISGNFNYSFFSKLSPKPENYLFFWSKMTRGNQREADRKRAENRKADKEPKKTTDFNKKKEKFDFFRKKTIIYHFAIKKKETRKF